MALSRATPAAKAVTFKRFLALVYLVMVGGLVITALVSTNVSTNPDLVKRFYIIPGSPSGCTSSSSSSSGR
ncbi:MAG: hypothetical protein EHM70_10360 [Chloroflexota bacterium]|nr:MAG: hypothetical protein EHM70_10360 [Chloroflexota bacterium]